MAETKFLDLTGLARFKAKNDALYAPIENAELTGEPTAPTAEAGTNNTQLATTAFVQAAIANLEGALVFKGTVANVAALPTLSADILGHVYNFSAAAVTTADFVEGAGLPIAEGTDVACCKPASGTDYKWTMLGGAFDAASVEADIATRLEKVSTMPAEPATGDVVLYTGASSTSYEQGGIYRYNGTEWALLDPQGLTAITNTEIDALFE